MKIKNIVLIIVLFWGGCLGRVTMAQEKNSTPAILPRPDFHFPGSVGRTYLESDPPQFPKPVEAPKGAPNVLLILLDDAGFGQFSIFGGGVPSPTVVKLAAEVLRYERFQYTARC